MTHIENAGYRPVFDDQACGSCTDCLPYCPGAAVTAPETPSRYAPEPEFGACLEIYEGWATDDEVRRRGSSGGVLSALSLYCLERGNFSGVLHAGMDPAEPWRNRNFISTTRVEVLARAGSRYAPSMPCELLGEARPTAGPYVFIGKPCDTAAASALIDDQHPAVGDIGLVLTFFCAGTPSTRGTLDLLGSAGVDRQQVAAVAYRGNGWPGDFQVANSAGRVIQRLTYEESWAKLTSYRPLRCNLCPDGLGRAADISCGDAWHDFQPGDPGRSLILVRSERGRALLSAAAAAGYVTLRAASETDVQQAQKNLLQRRRELFGRLLGLALLGAPTSRYKNFSLWRAWMALPITTKTKTVLGTINRGLRRQWWRRLSLRRGSEAPHNVHELTHP